MTTVGHGLLRRFYGRDGATTDWYGTSMVPHGGPSVDHDAITVWHGQCRYLYGYWWTCHGWLRFSTKGRRSRNGVNKLPSIHIKLSVLLRHSVCPQRRNRWHLKGQGKESGSNVRNRLRASAQPCSQFGWRNEPRWRNEPSSQRWWFCGVQLSPYSVRGEPVCVCVCEFGFNVAFNNFSVISRRCLVVTGSSMLTFIVLPHWSIMSQTLDMIPHPVTLSWHWVDQS